MAYNKIYDSAVIEAGLSGKFNNLVNKEYAAAEKQYKKKLLASENTTFVSIYKTLCESCTVIDLMYPYNKFREIMKRKAMYALKLSEGNNINLDADAILKDFKAIENDCKAMKLLVSCHVKTNLSNSVYYSRYGNSQLEPLGTFLFDIDESKVYSFRPGYDSSEPVMKEINSVSECTEYMMEIRQEFYDKNMTTDVINMELRHVYRLYLTGVQYLQNTLGFEHDTDWSSNNPYSDCFVFGSNPMSYLKYAFKLEMPKSLDFDNLEGGELTIKYMFPGTSANLYYTAWTEIRCKTPKEVIDGINSILGVNSMSDTSNALEIANKVVRSFKDPLSDMNSLENHTVNISKNGDIECTIDNWKDSAIELLETALKKLKSEI